MSFTVLYDFDIQAARAPTIFGIRVLNVAKKYATLIRQEYEGVTQYWRHKPLIEKPQIGYRGGDLVVSVGTNDEIYGYVSGGTSVRYATMHPKFQAKTSVGTLATNPGQYPNPHYVNTLFPRPGIEAREFEKQIREKYEDIFKADIKNAIRAGLIAQARAHARARFGAAGLLKRK